jgi:hypothetical protein
MWKNVWLAIDKVGLGGDNSLLPDQSLYIFAHSKEEEEEVEEEEKKKLTPAGK